MIQYNEYFTSAFDVERLGFPEASLARIPDTYLNNKQFILFRTCHSYGDWVLLSAVPRLLKEKYPDCIVVIPSPECIAKYFSPDSWHHKHESPFNNVIEIFKNNPYVDGMIDELPEAMPIYHDHFRIYDEKNSSIPIARQMLKFWGFSDDEMKDCQPELYWDDEEISSGDSIIKKLFGNSEFGFLYIDDTFLYHINLDKAAIDLKRSLIQREIDKHNLPWLYYSGNDAFIYNTNSTCINVKDLRISLRVQNYIKSKSKVVIGHQGGYGTDCMPRYTNCYVIPLCVGTGGAIAEHLVPGSNYIYE